MKGGRTIGMKIDIREIWFYKSGNSFLGNVGKLRFKIAPAGEDFQVFTWKEDRCFEKADHGEPTIFPLSEGGLSQIKDYLEKQADKG